MPTPPPPPVPDLHGEVLIPVARMAFDHWGLSDHEAATILDVAPDVWASWCAVPPATLPPECLDRMTEVVALEVLTWCAPIGARPTTPGGPHPLFLPGTGPDGVRPAIDWLRTGRLEDLRAVRVAFERAVDRAYPDPERPRA